MFGKLVDLMAYGVLNENIRKFIANIDKMKSVKSALRKEK